MAVGIFLAVLELIPLVGLLFAFLRFLLQTTASLFLAVYLPALTVTYLHENRLEPGGA
jgi:hypothetical protein